MSDYNGWVNWATWNVALWFGNDEELYNAIRHFRGGDADDAERLVREILPNGTPDMDDASEYDDVDWEEIANAWNEE